MLKILLGQNYRGDYMFYLDGISLEKIKNEFEKEILGKKIGKISQETALSVTLNFGRTSLVFSCASSFPICYLSEEKSQKLDIQFNFLLSLRKYFSNSALIKIEQLGLDRVLIFHFKKMNELGEVKIYKLYFELMGKHSNLIITDEKNKILDLLKRFSLEENSFRILLPGADYKQPLFTLKKSLFEIKEEEFSSLQEEGLHINYEGIGKYLAQSLSNFTNLKNILEGEIEPKIFLKNDKIILATVLPELSISDYDDILYFENFGKFVEYYMEKTLLNSTIESLNYKIVGTISKKIKKLKKILLNIELDNQDKENYINYKNYGDILSANIYSLKKYISSVTLFDFYNNVEVEIDLDSKLTPQKNIENYYKKYNKLKRGLESNKRRVIEVSEEIEYLESVISFAQITTTSENLKSIISELENGGYLKKESQPKKKKKELKKECKAVFIENEKYSIIYGRNNIENEFVTFKIAIKEDLWFHIRNIPGSHVVLKIKREDLTDEIISEAAQLAIKFSSAKLGDKVIVDYTYRKNVSKPKGAKIGNVIFKNSKEFIGVK